MKIEKDLRKKRETILLKKQITLSKGFIKKKTLKMEAGETLKNSLNKKADDLFNIKLKKAYLNQNESKFDSINFRSLLKKNDNKFLEDARNIDKE